MGLTLRQTDAGAGMAANRCRLSLARAERRPRWWPHRSLAKRTIDIEHSSIKYIDRGSEDENALQRNRCALDAVRIKTRVLTGGGVRTQAVSLFNENQAAPIIIAPTAFAGLVRFRGEIELARAAASRGVPFCAAAEAITAVEEIAAAAVHRSGFKLGQTRALAGPN
ncbi:alpha-hydroxy-acid oxidizing protein [Bradyrhizobium sp. WSM 1738]|nr:alpha-hydroxy-acid oxidizing protein [Bradyrhizobium hereditatis]